MLGSKGYTLFWFSLISVITLPSVVSVPSKHTWWFGSPIVPLQPLPEYPCLQQSPFFPQNSGQCPVIEPHWYHIGAISGGLREFHFVPASTFRSTQNLNCKSGSGFFQHQANPVHLAGNSVPSAGFKTGHRTMAAHGGGPQWAGVAYQKWSWLSTASKHD